MIVGILLMLAILFVLLLVVNGLLSRGGAVVATAAFVPALRKKGQMPFHIPPTIVLLIVSIVIFFALLGVLFAIFGKTSSSFVFDLFGRALT